MHKVIYNAFELPAEWESIIGDNLFMTIPFLAHLEQSQKRQTEYHLFYHKDKLDSIFVLFIYPDFPFLMHTRLSYSKRISMIYFPLPFSRSSIIIGSNTRKEVESAIKKIKGFTLLINIPKEDLFNLPHELSFARCTMQLKWDSLDGYLNSLRSHYRYKYLKTLKHSSNLEIKEIDSREFNNDLYRLYENVFERTELKINKAEPAFFQSDYSKILTISTSTRCIGFVQLIDNGKELIFSLIGMEYDHSRKYNLYQRLMLEVIRYGIDRGYESIDFGQTTYDAKQKLGSEIKELYIQVNHSNILIFKLLLLFRNVLLQKQNYSKTYHVFKNQGG